MIIKKLSTIITFFTTIIKFLSLLYPIKYGELSFLNGNIIDEALYKYKLIKIIYK